MGVVDRYGNELKHNDCVFGVDSTGELSRTDLDQPIKGRIEIPTSPDRIISHIVCWNYTHNRFSRSGVERINSTEVPDEEVCASDVCTKVDYLVKCDSPNGIILLLTE